MYNFHILVRNAYFEFRRHLLLLHTGKTHDTKSNDRFCPQSHAITEKNLGICKLCALRSKWYFQLIFGLFSSSRIVNYNFMKNEGYSVISVWILVCLPVASAAYWNYNEKKNCFKIIIDFFVTPPLFLATKVAISFVYCSPKTIKCTQKPKIEKKFRGVDQSSERASVRVLFPTSHLQLALAHARNSRV